MKQIQILYCTSIIGIPKGGRNKILKIIIAKNLPSLMKSRGQKTQQSLSKRIMKKNYRLFLEIGRLILKLLWKHKGSTIAKQP